MGLWTPTSPPSADQTSQCGQSSQEGADLYMLTGSLTLEASTYQYEVTLRRHLVATLNMHTVVCMYNHAACIKLHTSFDFVHLKGQRAVCVPLAV